MNLLNLKKVGKRVGIYGLFYGGGVVKKEITEHCSRRRSFRRRRFRRRRTLIFVFCVCGSGFRILCYMRAYYSEIFRHRGSLLIIF